MKTRISTILVLLMIALVVFGCKDKPEEPATAKLKKEKILNLFNYEDYIGSDTLENFEAETGIHVNETYFADEEEMLGVVQSDLTAYDLVVVSDDAVKEMREARLLAQLDHSKIPNLVHIGQKHRNLPYDPEQRYSIPYLIGTTGVVVNKKYVKGDTDSWKVLFDKQYQGKLAMLSDPFEVAAVALKLLGYSMNSTNVEELEKARDLLLEQKPLLNGYYDDTKMMELVVNEEVWATHIFSGEGLLAMEQNEDLEYIIPKEGAPIWVDCFVVLRGAKHKEEAHQLIDYILRPEVNASIASELWYATPNEAAIPLMDPEVAESEIVFPPPEVLARCEYFRITGVANTIISAMWSDLTVED